MSASNQRPGISMLEGTPKELGVELRKSRANRALALTFDEIESKAFETLADNLLNIVSSMFEVMTEHHERATLERLVELLVPRAPAPARLLKEARMLVEARKVVLESGDWLTAAEIAALAGLSSRNPSAQPNKWKKQGAIFAISHNGVDYFPAYGLDRDSGFRPIKGLAEVIKVFATHKNAWGIAYWFFSINSFLGGKRPQELLASHADRVVDAAIDEVQGVTHG